MKPRVRFAPSPTGYLHIGGARTALFNWLYARHTGGTFILRIEDTDAARNSQEAVEVILSGLRWLGLDWDEGPIVEQASSLCDSPTQQKLTGKMPVPLSKGNFGPYFQSQRKANYLARVEALLSRGLAYEHEGAVKFKMQREPVTIHDLVVGDVVRKLTDREEVDPDFVILRSDGQPVFHLVNVIDDLEMDITHVIRGEDHLSNTAKHIALFQAFGVKPPHYAHIPLILNGDGSKMSKRDTGASLTGYLDEGFLPEAVINYLCLLGWSPKDNREKLSRAEVIERFDLPQILRHNARFDYEKLLWLQGEYARELADDRFYELAVHAFAKAGMDTNKFPLPYVKAALDTCKGKFKLFSELPAYAGFYFRDEIIYNADDAKKVFIPENKPRLEKLRDAFAALTPFNAATLETALKETAKQLGVKAGVLIHPTRLAATGNPNGPSLYHLLEVLGKEKSLARIEKALANF
ncbi:MAG TPA: glutamate--tRNA ligase family protein [Verrucomicrobiae bacterium]|jgi:glutamyl-tRNA synthetase